MGHRASHSGLLMVSVQLNVGRRKAVLRERRQQALTKLFPCVFLLAGIRQATSPTQACFGIEPSVSGPGTRPLLIQVSSRGACLAGNSSLHVLHSLHSLSLESVPLLLQHLQPGLHVLLWPCALLLLLRLLAPCRRACLPASLLLLLRLPSVLMGSLPATTGLLAHAGPSMPCCSLVRCWLRISSRSLRS